MPEDHRLTEGVGDLLKSLQAMAALVSEAAADTAQAAAAAGADTPPQQRILGVEITNIYKMTPG